MLRAVNHKLRQYILTFLLDGPKTVTDIYLHFRLEQSVASQHLSILRLAKIVTTTRDGKFIHYAVDTDRLSKINTQVKVTNAL